jgi:NADH dehydrogenase
MTPPRVVIVGAGFGGLRAARSLRHAPVEVTVVDRHNHHLFQPLLYQVATAILSPGEIAPPVRGILRDQGNATVVLGEVCEVNVAGQHLSVRGVDGETHLLYYDFLVVAAGSESSYFGHDDWSPYLFPMKTIDEALALRSRLLDAYEVAHEKDDQEDRQAWTTFAIVGGGPAGVELAGELATVARELRSEFHSGVPLHPKVVLIDGGDDVLTSFPTKLRAVASQRLIELGVELRLSRMAVGVDDSGLTLEAKNGTTERLKARTVIWSAGVQASNLAAQLGAATGATVDHRGRVTVGPDCALPGHPEVFVIGDAANCHNLPGLCEPAIQEGRYVARVINQQVNGEADPGPFRYRDLGIMATVGPRNAVADAFGIKLSGIPGKIAWAGVHIPFLIGWGNRAGVLSRWLWDIFSRRQGERVILNPRGPQQPPLRILHVEHTAGDHQLSDPSTVTQRVEGTDVRDTS